MRAKASTPLRVGYSKRVILHTCQAMTETRANRPRTNPRMVLPLSPVHRRKEVDDDDNRSGQGSAYRGQNDGSSTCGTTWHSVHRAGSSDPRIRAVGSVWRASLQEPDDGQANDEKANTRQDLTASLRCFGPKIARQRTPRRERTCTGCSTPGISSAAKSPERTPWRR